MLVCAEIQAVLCTLFVFLRLVEELCLLKGIGSGRNMLVFNVHIRLMLDSQSSNDRVRMFMMFEH